MTVDCIIIFRSVAKCILHDVEAVKTVPTNPSVPLLVFAGKKTGYFHFLTLKKVNAQSGCHPVRVKPKIIITFSLCYAEVGILIIRLHLNCIRYERNVENSLDHDHVFIFQPIRRTRSC